MEKTNIAGALLHLKSLTENKPGKAICPFKISIRRQLEKFSQTELESFATQIYAAEIARENLGLRGLDTNELYYLTEAFQNKIPLDYFVKTKDFVEMDSILRNCYNNPQTLSEVKRYALRLDTEFSKALNSLVSDKQYRDLNGIGEKARNDTLSYFNVKPTPVHAQSPNRNQIDTSR